MKKIALVAILIAFLFTGPNLIARNIDDLEFNKKNNDLSLVIFDDGDDFLDQYQNEDTSGAYAIYKTFSQAQSFIPSYEVLTRIKLLLGRSGEVNFDLHIYVIGEFGGESFVHVIIPKENIPETLVDGWEWIEIDFEDIIVNVGETYYIVLMTSSAYHYSWKTGFWTGYSNGDAWYHNEGDETWTKDESRDFCFETYGRPNLKTTFIAGKIHDISSEGNYLTFNAIKIRCMQFNPFTFVTLQADEELIISKSFKGIVAAGFIFAICDASLL